MIVEAPPEAPGPTPEPVGAPSAPRFAYVPALDGIRAFAVIAVLLFHGGVLTGGYLGVDAFFVLSGFLITSLIVHEVNATGGLGLKHFWARRARRLLPALFLLILAVGVYAAVFADRTDLERIRSDAFATLLYVANWRAIFSGHGYWDLFQAPSPLEHMWSLAIEEQFYLVWPLIMAGLTAIALDVARRRHRTASLAPIVFVVAAGAAAISAAWCVILFSPSDTSRAYLGTDTRVAAILVGAALAAWTVWRGPVRTRAARIALEVTAVGAIAFLAYEWSRLDGQAPFLYRGGLIACGIAVAVVIAAAAHPVRGPIGWALGWRPLVLIGLISYGLYLWHWPVYLVLNQERTGLDGYQLLALRIAASVAVATASFLLVERPIRRGTLPGRRALVVVPIAVATCIAVILLTTAGAQNLPDAGAKFVGQASGPSKQDVRDVARSAAASGASKLLVLGDSVGVGIGQSAQRLTANTDTAVVPGAISGCVFTQGVDGYQANLKDRQFVVPDVHDCTDAWLASARQFDPDTVLFVFGSGGSFLNVRIDGKWVDACSAAYQSWYAERLTAFIDTLHAGGARTVELLTLPYPVADFLPANARASIDCVNAVHAKVAQRTPGVAVLDLAGLICPGGACRTDADGVPLRSDGLHFDSGAAADYVATWVLDQSGLTGG